MAKVLSKNGKILVSGGKALTIDAASNVKEVTIQTTITNVSELANAIENVIGSEISYMFYLEREITSNNEIASGNVMKVNGSQRVGNVIRYRDNKFSTTSVGGSYDATANIGDVYAVITYTNGED